MPREESPQRCDETCPGALAKTTSDSSRNEFSRNTSNCTICDSDCQTKSHVSTISNSSLSKADEGKKKWIICFRGIFAKNKFSESPSEPTSQLKDSATDLKSIKTEGSGSECSCCDCKKKNAAAGEKELCDCPDKEQCSVECQPSNNPNGEKDKKALCDCIDKTQCSEECQPLNNPARTIFNFEDTLPEPIQFSPECVDFNDNFSSLPTDTSPPQPCENDCSPNNLDNSRKFSCPDTCPLTSSNYPAPSTCPAISSKVSTGSEVLSKRHTQNETSVPFKASIYSIRPTECPNLIIPPVCLHICSEITPLLPIISEGCFEDLTDPEPTPQITCPIPIKRCTEPPDSTVPDGGNNLSCSSSCNGSCHSTEMDVKSNNIEALKECTKSSSNESNCSCCVCTKDFPKQLYATICPSESPKFPIFPTEGSEKKPTSSTQTACKCRSTSSDVSVLDVSDIPLFICPTQKYTTDSPTVCSKQKSRSVEVKSPICKHTETICQKRSIQSVSSCRCLDDEKDVASVVKSELAEAKCHLLNCPAGDTNTTEGGTDLVKKSDKPGFQAPHHASKFKPKCSLVCRNKNVSPVCSLESELICFKMSESIELSQSTECPSQASGPKKLPNFQRDSFKPKICRRMQNHAKSVSRKVSTVTICLVDCSTLTNPKCANIIPTNSGRSSKKCPASAASENITDTTDSKHIWKSEARPSSASECRLDEFAEEECSCETDSMNKSQKSSCWSRQYNQKPPCSFCRQPVQDCVCSSKKPTDWTQSKSNTLFGKYKCTICNKPILDCKCKPSIFEDDDSSGSSEPKQMSPKCSTCNKPIQNCKCIDDSTFSGWNNKPNPKPKYSCTNCNNQIQECICKQTVRESDDDSGEDLDSICESSQTNLNECKCLTCAKESARNNEERGCPLRTFPKRSQAKCIGCYKLLQDCTCKPTENIMKIDEVDYNHSPKCSRCNKKNQECTCRSKQFQCPGCNRPLQACVCKSKTYQRNNMNKPSSSAPAYTKYKCKTCNQQVQDCTCTINISKEDCTPNVAKCIGCKKPLQDCICKPSVAKASSFGKYKCTSCSQPISVCTCDTDFSRKSYVYQKSSVSTRPSLAKCLVCNKPLQDCTCKPNIREDNSWERSYNNKTTAKYNCTNCYQPVEDCTCNSNNPSRDFTYKKSQLSSVKCVRSFSKNNTSRTKPKQKCLRCKKPIQECKCTSIGVETSSSNDTIDCSCKSNTRKQRENEAGPKCLGCNRPLKDCICRDSHVEASNYSFTRTKPWSKPAYTKYKCSSCSMPLLECKCSPSNTASIVIDRDYQKTPFPSKQSSSGYRPRISKDEEREIDNFSFQNTYVCADCNKPIQECKCTIDKTPNQYTNRGFSSSTKSQPKYKCSECYKPLQQCTCKTEISESVSDLECFDCNEPINQCECKPKKYETTHRSSVKSRPKYVCCSCKKPIEDCICQSNKKDNSPWDQKYTCSECRQSIQKCECKQDVDLIPIPALPKLKYLSCNNSTGKGERSKIRSSIEQDNYSSMYSKSRSRTKYICCKCNKPIEECICDTSVDLMNQMNENRSGKYFPSSDQKNICSKCSNYADPEPSCELLEDYPCKLTSLGKNTSNGRYNISSEGRSRNCYKDNIEDNRKQERSVVSKSSNDASYQLNRKCNDLCSKQSMKRSSNKLFCKTPKKKSTKICRPKDFPHFPHPSLLTEPCPDNCESKIHLECPLKKECSSINLKSSKYRPTVPARKQFDMYCTLDKPLSSRIQPSLSLKDELTDCPPLFLKVCPVPKVGSRCSSSRIKKFPSKIRNCIVSKAASRKSFKEKRRSPQNCSSGMREFRERDSSRRLYQRKSCKRCNQPIPEYQSVEDNVGYSSITNDMKNYSPYFQNNKNCKFN